MALSFTSAIGMVVGVIFIVIPEPTTTAIGLAMVAYTAYKIGWMGKGGS